MNWADIAILIVVGVSAVISLFRGFVREVLSVVAWVVAFWVAFVFTTPVADMLATTIANASVRSVVVFLGLLFGTLIITGVINYLIGRVVDKTGLSGTDRMLGVVFGVARGVAVIGVLVLLGRLAGVTDLPFWQESQLLAHFDRLATWLVSFFPEDLAGYFT